MLTFKQDEIGMNCYKDDNLIGCLRNNECLGSILMTNSAVDANIERCVKNGIILDEYEIRQLRDYFLCGDIKSINETIRTRIKELKDEIAKLEDSLKLCEQH